MTTKLTALLITGTALLGVLAGNNLYAQGHTDQLHDMRTVYTLCSTSNTQACQQAQTDTSTEYLCNTSGNCWVEVK
jgi:hypothetical protein